MGSPFNIDPSQAQALTDKLQDLGPKIEQTLVSGIGTIVPIVGQAVVTLVLAIVMTGYILRDGDRYWNWALGFVEEPRRPAINDLGRSAYSTLAAYLQGTSIVAVFNSAAITFGAFLLGLPLLMPIADHHLRRSLPADRRRLDRRVHDRSRSHSPRRESARRSPWA